MKLAAKKKATKGRGRTIRATARREEERAQRKREQKRAFARAT